MQTSEKIKIRIHNPIYGVPITFLYNYCPEQFEIVSFRKGEDGKDLVFTREEERKINKTADNQVIMGGATGYSRTSECLSNVDSGTIQRPKADDNQRHAQVCADNDKEEEVTINANPTSSCK